MVSNGFALFTEFDQATRVMDHSATCIDHIIYQIIPEFFSVVLFYQNIGHHYPIMCSWSINTDDDKIISQHYQDTKFFHDSIKIQAFLNSHEAGLCQREGEFFLCDNPNEPFSIFSTKYISNVEQFAPLETFRKQPNLKPNCFNIFLKNLSMKRNQAHIENERKSETVLACHLFSVIVISLELPIKSKKHFFC